MKNKVQFLNQKSSRNHKKSQNPNTKVQQGFQLEYYVLQL